MCAECRKKECDAWNALKCCKGFLFSTKDACYLLGHKLLRKCSSEEVATYERYRDLINKIVVAKGDLLSCEICEMGKILDDINTFVSREVDAGGKNGCSASKYEFGDLLHELSDEELDSLILQREYMNMAEDITNGLNYRVSKYREEYQGRTI
ncbi:MAG: hypothetical protein HUJ78_05195 [Mogibacterium sp.]|nr:hypothetical protein [Mogibacterium sp.]